MKKIVVFCLLIAGVTSASALSCLDLPKNLSRYQESSSILSLQNFLAEKGLLKNKPNGYFGVGTFAAVKAYQKSLGLSQGGNVGPATRAAIKQESCKGKVITTTTTTTTTKPVETKPAIKETPKTPAELRNERRKSDITAILQALYRRYVDSRGVHAIPVSDTPIELCVVPPTKPSTATATEVAVLTSPTSPCANYADITSLSPTYLQNIPRDPTLATSSTLTGYTITRSVNNDIVIAPKSTDNSAVIKAKCNFNGFCQNIEYITKQTYGRPEITSINRTILLRDASPRTPLIIKGSNFTATNTIKFFSLYNSREYTLGTFPATNYTATTSAVPLEGAILTQEFPCGTNCSQKLPLGEYAVTVTNEGGVSNQAHVVMRGFTTSSISTQVNQPIVPTTKNVKVASITISSSIPVSIKTLTLTSTSTSKNLASKLSNFVLKDVTDSSTISGGSSGSFSFSGVDLYENQSRVYDLYLDTAEVYVEDAGFITYGGKFLVNDPFSYVDMEIPIKEFSFTVSH